MDQDIMLLSSALVIQVQVCSVAKVWDFPIIDGFSRDYISNNK